MKKHKQAITFVEIMIACVIMAVVFMVGTAVSNSFTGTKKVRNYETAIALANQAIEAVRAARSIDLGSNGKKQHGQIFLDKGPRKDMPNDKNLVKDFSSSNDPFDNNLDGFVPVVDIGGVKYTRTVSIEDVHSMNADIQTGLKTIRVTVSWKAKEDNTPVTFEVVTAHCDLW